MLQHCPKSTTEHCTTIIRNISVYVDHLGKASCAILYVGFWQTKRKIITIILSLVSLIYLDACNWLLVQCVCMRTYSWHSIRQGSYMNILVHCLKHIVCLCEKWQFCFEGHTLKSVIRNTIRSKLHSKMIHTMWNN